MSSGFTFSARSIKALQGVHPDLVRVTRRALELTKVDFAVTEGLRTEARQRELVASGASQTMSSKHITGHAVDLVAFIGGRISWELNLYDDIADAMKAAATEYDVPLLWGAAWNVPDIRHWKGTMAEAMNYYIDARRAQKRRPFVDAPHFEIP